MTFNDAIFLQTETIWDAFTGGTLLFLTDKWWCIICHVRTFQVTANTSKVISLPDTVQEGEKALRTEFGAVGQGVLECIWHPLKQSMPVGPICWAVRWKLKHGLHLIYYTAAQWPKMCCYIKPSHKQPLGQDS